MDNFKELIEAKKLIEAFLKACALATPHCTTP